MLPTAMDISLSKTCASQQAASYWAKAADSKLYRADSALAVSTTLCGPLAQ